MTNKGDPKSSIPFLNSPKNKVHREKFKDILKTENCEFWETCVASKTRIRIFTEALKLPDASRTKNVSSNSLRGCLTISCLQKQVIARASEPMVFGTSHCCRIWLVVFLSCVYASRFGNRPCCLSGENRVYAGKIACCVLPSKIDI